MTSTNWTMSTNLRNRVKERLKEYEGNGEAPYLDSRKLLTVGHGSNMETGGAGNREGAWNAFRSLPFQVTDEKTGTLRPATAEEIKAGFDHLWDNRDDLAARAPKVGKAAENFWEGQTSLRLGGADRDTLLGQEVDRRLPAVINQVGPEVWNRLTDDQRMGFIDIAFGNGSLTNFNRLKAAAQVGDAGTMARESGFHSGGDRNWARLQGNHCSMLGLAGDSQDCQRSFADQVRNQYKDRTPPSDIRKQVDVAQRFNVDSLWNNPNAPAQAAAVSAAQREFLARKQAAAQKQARKQASQPMAPAVQPAQPTADPSMPYGFDNLFAGHKPEPYLPEGFDNLFPPERQGPEPAVEPMASPEPEPLPADEIPSPYDDEWEDGFFGKYHQGGEVSDGDPATDNATAKAVVEEGEFVLAKATVEGIDAELVKALNDLAKADPSRAKKLRGALAAAVGDHPPYGEEQLRKMMAESRHYWDPDSPHREEAFLRMARLYQQAFPEGDAEGRTPLSEGGLVAGKHWQRKNEDVPTELPEGSFVLSQEAVKAYGADVLELLNAAGIVKDRFALTEVRKAIAAIQGKRLKLREDELRRVMADPRYWKHVNADYIRMVTNEYKHTYSDLNKGR